MTDADRQFESNKTRFLETARTAYGHWKKDDVDILVCLASGQVHQQEERLRLLDTNARQAQMIAQRDRALEERDSIIARMALLAGRPLLQEAVASLRAEQPSNQPPILAHVHVAARETKAT